MDSLPSEIINEILLRVDRPSLFQASQVSLSWRGLALKQVVKIEDRKGFREVCRKGDRLSITKFRYPKEWSNDGLYGACLGGHRDLVDLMIEKGADNWNWGLYSACLGGHRDLTVLMISKGANHWNLGLYYACQGGHRNLVDLMIQKGATQCNSCNKSLTEHLS